MPSIAKGEERLILFESPDDFRFRVGYQEDLSLPKGHSFTIIGGYRFKKVNWLRCGVSSCKTLHGNGYVIRSADALETNIGHCCGQTILGAEWKAMFERFETRRKEEALQDVLARVLGTRDATLKQAETALHSLEAAAGTVRRIVTALECYGPLKRAFRDCLKQRGSLAYFRATTADEREMFRGQTSVRETKGHIDGWHAAAVDSNWLARELRFRVIVPLAEIQPDVLRGLPFRALEQRLRDFSSMASIVQMAEVYVEDAAKLSKPLNWHKFELYCDASKVQMDHQGYKALRTLAGTA
ncbi:hypothetical protein [Hydrogenophaga sp.]|uniref:hypothetical protein n=1 Tax=Hydrogenophaga sp. TaxID=1904254 RepID=UPI002731B81E|nr:hypothetical protein [Hydrogenophaga sp.]MDP2018968.1 hypothetical protein [Hydrogenophaga sp.]MDP3164346.1 hypothetical protein [Hydrogenophaga sp.]